MLGKLDSIKRIKFKHSLTSNTKINSKWIKELKVKSKVLGSKVFVFQSCPSLHDPWTAAHQVPFSVAFPRKEGWSGLPFPSPGDLPDPEIKPGFSALPTFFTNYQGSYQGSPHTINVSLATIKLLEENSTTPSDTNSSKIFLDSLAE